VLECLPSKLEAKFKPQFKSSKNKKDRKNFFSLIPSKR
jgi:hypothetical protein